MGVRRKPQPYDLDTRPTGASRSSIYIWVQRCPGCGYCAPDIAQGSADIRRIIDTREYRQRLRDRKFPEALNHFRCWSMVRETAGDYGAAGWAALHAAWVCDDDAGRRQYATEYRTDAYRLFTMAQSRGNRFASSPIEEELVKIDILRRCGRFDEAARLCAKQLAENSDQKALQILTYQQDLIEEKDGGKHTIGEAVEED
jgi:hypothetical protein